MTRARADGQALRKALARGERGGIFFLHGDEEYLKDEAVQAIIDAHLDPATRDFNLDQLRATGLDPETLASICHTPPMLAEWRVVVVRDANALATTNRTRAVVESLIAKPIPGLALVFVLQGSDRSAKLWNAVEKNARSIEFAALPQAELPEWLAQRGEASGITLEPEAARALAAAAGPELQRLVRELDKLVDYAAARKNITLEDVRNLVPNVPQITRWDWFDRVGEGRFAEARQSLPIILDSETGVGLIIGLGVQLLRIAIAVAGGERALMAALPPQQQRWLGGRIARQARNWTRDRIDAALRDLLRADRLLKSASLDQQQVLEELLLRLESRQKAAA